MYIDNDGKRWSGRVCNPCHNKRLRDDYNCIRDAMPKMSYKERINLKKGKPANSLAADMLIGPEFPMFGGKLRRCPGCALPTVNYYKCKECTPYRAASEVMDMYGVAL